MTLFAVLDLQGYDDRHHTTREAIKYQHNEPQYDGGNMVVKRTKVSCFSKFSASIMMLLSLSLVGSTKCSACSTPKGQIQPGQVKYAAKLSE
jgi:hypothetical protein